ncbi:hypothetical protein [uncultured Cohaesibacter sp.]|uniref:hypothetical protein n=1 Tax=uncultured Cohaesibacter sp. TaxID=1002546 RepID=UPI002931C989|nr:hypothetical protein [uncultured Cohaesibacter sp.]
MIGTGKKTDQTMQHVRASLVIFLFAAVVLAAFESGGLLSWSYDLPINAGTEQLVSVIEKWSFWMDELGITQGSERIDEIMQDVKEKTF